jgi:hypothetical protein
MHKASKTIVTRVTVEEPSYGSFMWFNVKWLEEVGDDKGCKNGREWAALADALFHE